MQSAAQTTRNHRLLVLAAVLLVAGSWLLWSWARGPQVTTVAPLRGTAAEIVYATGAVEPVRWSKVTSLVRNRLIEICDCEGKTVAKGEVLARLEEREVRAQLDELKAREELAKRELTRISQLLDRRIATPQAYERALADVQQVQALISAQTQKIAEYTIVAPMDGVVLRRDGEVGEIVEAGQVLFRVGVPRPLRVVAEVNEEDIPRVAIGQKVLFRTDAFAGRLLEGRIREITPMGDPVAKTYRIRVALPDDTPLQIGMSVEANIVTKEKPNALLVPAEALQGKTLVVAEGSRARRRTVETGIRGTHAVEILSGIGENDRIISPFPPDLKDGARIRPAAAPGAAK
ncbi:MAG: efflux RND transporter periplasmic adaptor subunit [Hyphomicrobiaceae bacterium]|nr:MAG: efflux RND transporter periplasmic adaptor subunit [Hyphomicrobiaceae bacterium]